MPLPADFRTGARTALPVLLAVVPFGLVSSRASPP